MLSNEVIEELGLPKYFIDTYNLTEMVTFWPIFVQVFKQVPHQIICEVGANLGYTSKLLEEYCVDNERTLVIVDPLLSEPVKELEYAQLHEKTSLDFFSDGGKADIYILDGDHNYSTVKMELDSIKFANGLDGMVCLLHDVGWPWARRDIYYNPNENYIRDYSYNKSLHLETNGFSDRGFPNGTTYAMADEYGGACNGVQTAIDDFLKSNSGLKYYKFPSLYGLGILISENLITEELNQFLNNIMILGPMLGILEANRLRLIQGLHEHQIDLTKNIFKVNELEKQIKKKEEEDRLVREKLLISNAETSILEELSARQLKNDNEINRLLEESKFRSKRIDELIEDDSLKNMEILNLTEINGSLVSQIDRIKSSFLGRLLLRIIR